jgi:hypothetical protein
VAGGQAPRTSGQFADALPLIPLPLVPVRTARRPPAGAAPDEAAGAAVNGAQA